MLQVGFILALICAVQSARILGVFHIPTYSHFLLGDIIFRELASRGHEVTVITPYELKVPVKNLKHVVLTGFLDVMEDVKVEMYKEGELNVWTKIAKVDMILNYFTENVLKHANVQKLLQSDAKFDLLIYDYFGNDAFAGFAEYYKIPKILISTFGTAHWIDSAMGNPHNPAYVPDLMLNYSPHMDLLQRTWNTLVYVGSSLFQHFHTEPTQNQLLQKYFPGSSDLSQLRYNASLVLLNSHVSTHQPLPFLPNMIEIGGYHIQPSKPLPKDLQVFLDEAKDGAIFFSMGSNLKSKDMPERTRKIILTVLGKLKQKVLWKWEDESLPAQPSNVKIGKWFPQQDILAHPNIRLFITHGGLLSTTEAIHYGVPVLGLPVYGDQLINIVIAERAGYAKGIPIEKINENEFSAALEELLSNRRYTEKVKERSRILNDRPQKPMDTAIYWIEYVLRHGGAYHMQSAALNLSWYQYLLLDVVAVVTLSFVLIVYLFYKLINISCKVCCKGKKVKIN